MKQLLAIALAVLLVGTAQIPSAQQAASAADLVSSWTLAAVEKGVASGQPTRVQGPRGLLIIDAAGHVFEFFSTASRDEPEAPQLDPQATFDRFGGFWGRYEAEPGAGRITFHAEAGVSPSVGGLTFSRSYELEGDRLVLTSTREPQAQGDTRWTWQRVPTVANFTPAYRQVVGFWQHEIESRVNAETGEVQSSNERGPSVIVYTPGGFVGVHFTPVGRKPFAGDRPTREEAEAALRGYIGYFGTLNVYPGEVSHNLLAGINPATGSVLRRYADITDDQLVVRLQPTLAPPGGGRGGGRGNGPRLVVTHRLHRLSGADQMLPPPR